MRLCEGRTRAGKGESSETSTLRLDVPSARATKADGRCPPAMESSSIHTVS